MPRQRWTDYAQLIFAEVFLAGMAFWILLAFFDSLAVWGTFLWFVGYVAIGVYVATADQPADPNLRLPPSLEVAFHGFRNEKGLGITGAALFLGMILLMVVILLTLT
jgi:hypothetical protein